MKKASVLFAFLAFPLSGLTSELCLKSYSMSSAINFDSRLEMTFKQVTLLSESNQDHPSVVASYILQKTDRLLNTITDFNDKTSTSDLKEKTPSFALLEKNNLKMETLLNDILSVSTKRFSLKTKGMKAKSIEQKMKELEDSKSEFERIGDQARKEMLELMQEVNKIKSQLSLLTNENEFINKLIEKLMNNGETSVSSVLLRKSVNIVSLETILQSKINTLDKHMATMDVLMDSSEKLRVIGLSSLVETTPKLQELMSIVKKNEEARLAAIESARLESIRRAKDQELRIKQANEARKERIENLDKNLKMAIYLSEISPYSDKRNKILSEFLEKNVDILSSQQAIQLALAATYSDTKNKILITSYMTHYKSLSLADVFSLVRAMTYKDKFNSTLKHFAVNNKSRLSVNELIQLANAASYNDIKTSILSIASQR